MSTDCKIPFKILRPDPEEIVRDCLGCFSMGSGTRNLSCLGDGDEEKGCFILVNDKLDLQR